MGGGRRWFLPSDQFRIEPRQRQRLCHFARRPGQRLGASRRQPRRARPRARCHLGVRRSWVCLHRQRDEPIRGTLRSDAWQASRALRLRQHERCSRQAGQAPERAASRRDHLCRGRLPRPRSADARRDDRRGAQGSGQQESPRVRANGRGRAHRQAVARDGCGARRRRDPRVRSGRRGGATFRRACGSEDRRHRARRPRVLGIQHHRRIDRWSRRPPGRCRPTAR